MSFEAAAARAPNRNPLLSTFSWITSLHTLRCRILQLGNPERSDLTCSTCYLQVHLCVYKPCIFVLLSSAIDEEWQRTQCMPRETCVDVAKELGTDPSMFFKPPCVSVHRFVYSSSNLCLHYPTLPHVIQPQCASLSLSSDVTWSSS